MAVFFFSLQVNRSGPECFRSPSFSGSAAGLPKRKTPSYFLVGQNAKTRIILEGLFNTFKFGVI